MAGRGETKIAAIQAVSSAVVALGVITLIRHQKRVGVPANSLRPGSQVDTSVESKIDHPAPSPEPQLPLRIRIIRRIVNVSILVPLLLLTFRFGSLESPGKIAILVGGIILYFGWGLFQPHWDGRAELLRRLRDLLLLALLAAFGAQGIAATEDLSARVQYVFIALFLIGLYLWKTEWQEKGSLANLGAALLGGIVVAATVFYIDVVVEGQNREDDLQVTVALQRDLSRADLFGRNLSHMYLPKKAFQETDLREADLSDSYIVNANLRSSWLENANLTRADLSESKLTDAQLYKANLAEANLIRSNLKGADLTEASLEGTDLTGAILIEADLTGVARLNRASLISANLAGSDLTNTDFRGASLDGASLVKVWQQDQSRGINLAGVSAVGANLSGADLQNANLANANLVDANLMGGTLERATLINTNLEHANLRGVDLRALDLRTTRLMNAVADNNTDWPRGFNPNTASVHVMQPGAKLRKADLINQKLTSVDLTSADLRETDLTGADLRRAKLSGARLQGAKLIGADLRKADLDKAQLRGATASSNTQWPQGFNPKSAGVRVLVFGD